MKESKRDIHAHLAYDKVNILDKQEQDGLFGKLLRTNGYLFFKV